MPSHFFANHTPERLLGRSDSRNPATTCRGITASGRPCRRAIPAAVQNVRNNGLSGQDHVDVSRYCWQHKDQAARNMSTSQDTIPEDSEFGLKGRSSIETFVKHLGITGSDISKAPKPSKRHKSRSNGNEQARTDQSSHVRDFASNDPRSNEKRPRPSAQRRKPQQSQPSFWATLCSMGDEDDDERIEIVRHRRRMQEQGRISSMPPRHAGPARPPVMSQSLPIRPAPQRRAVSNTSTTQLMSRIPGHLSPETTSSLFAELVKPLSPHDENGYIYIFWLTPQTKDAPPESTARSLLSPPGRHPLNDRRVSDVMTEYSYTEEDEKHCHSVMGSHKERQQQTRPTKPIVLLKIGRANNITRRMNEWQRQCGYALTLIRWYPYVSSSASPQPSPQKEVKYPDLSRPPTHSSQSENDDVRKVPFVKRVERLIHLELAERQIRRQCSACGKEHREWFEVEASRAGIRSVDEVVRRWVAWAEEKAREK